MLVYVASSAVNVEISVVVPPYSCLKSWVQVALAWSTTKFAVAAAVREDSNSQCAIHMINLQKMIIYCFIYDKKILVRYLQIFFYSHIFSRISWSLDFHLGKSGSLCGEVPNQHSTKKKDEDEPYYRLPLKPFCDLCTTKTSLFFFKTKRLISVNNRMCLQVSGEDKLKIF